MAEKVTKHPAERSRLMLSLGVGAALLLFLMRSFGGGSSSTDVAPGCDLSPESLAKIRVNRPLTFVRSTLGCDGEEINTWDYGMAGSGSIHRFADRRGKVLLVSVSRKPWQNVKEVMIR